VKIIDSLRSAVIGYFSIGIVIGLMQLSLNKVFEPPCNGLVKHTLWERGAEQETYFSKEIDFLLRVGSNVAQWLPDLYFQLIKGDMAMRDYLLGGYRCEPMVAARSLPSSLFSESLLDAPSLKEFNLNNDRAPGSLSGSLLKETPTTRLDAPGLNGLRLNSDRAPGSLSGSLLKEETPIKREPVVTLVPKSLQREPLMKGFLIKEMEEAPLAQSTPLKTLKLSDMETTVLKNLRAPDSAPAKKSAQESPFVTIEVLPGVSLALPRDWLTADSKEIQQHVTAGNAVYGTRSGIPTVENTQAFRPPTEAEGVGIVVASTPATLTQQELQAASDTQLREWVAIIEQQARRGVEAQGLKLLPLSDISRQSVGGWLGLAFKTQIVNAEGTVFEQTQIHIPTPSRTITLNLSYGKGAPPVFRPILAHARKTLQIIEPVGKL